MKLDGKRVAVTGATGSLGHALVRRLLTGEMGNPSVITVFSRDELKQDHMRSDWLQQQFATDAAAYGHAKDRLRFSIGDIRDYASVRNLVNRHDVIFSAAALKQVPACEYAPFEAVRTNIIGPENLVRATVEVPNPPELVVGVSTDKAVKPVNVMGMTKSLQERIYIHGNMRQPATRFVCARYGNVMSSRGSVIPLFIDQIKKGGPVTITTKDMTRFMMTLDEAVDTVFAAVKLGKSGDIIIPRLPAGRMVDVATALMGTKKVPMKITGIRPGEKIHEILISEEEVARTVRRGDLYGILPILPELRHEKGPVKPAIKGEYSSKDSVVGIQKIRQRLRDAGYGL